MNGKKNHNSNTLINNESEPLSYELVKLHIPPYMKILKREFDETRGLEDHLVHFSTKLNLYEAIDGIKCKAFPTKLKGLAAN